MKGAVAALIAASVAPTAGRHTITIVPAPFNPKEGGPYFHMTGYYLVGLHPSTRQLAAVSSVHLSI